MVLTKNEKGVLRLLATSIGKNLSINEVGKACKITPGGAHKILHKLEGEGILKTAPVANIIPYALNFDSEKTARVLELAFIPDELHGWVKAHAEYMSQLKRVTTACILFGQHLTLKKSPESISFLFILNQADSEEYKKLISGMQGMLPIKISPLSQTYADLERNIKLHDAAITEALRNGVVLWGFELIVKAVKNASVQ